MVEAIDRATLAEWVCRGAEVDTLPSVLGAATCIAGAAVILPGPRSPG